MTQQWKQPDVEPIYLSNGRVVEAHVNGKSLDGQHGWVFVEGCDIKVVLLDGQWHQEVGKGVS